MMRKFQISNFKFQIKFIGFFVLGLFLTLFAIPYTLYPINALTAGCTAGTPPRSDALVSSNTIAAANKFGSGKCVSEPSVNLSELGSTTFEDLKSLYYDQAKDDPSILVNKNNPLTSGPFTQSNITMDPEDQIYYLDGDLNLNSRPSGNRSGIVLVDGNLTVNNDITNPSSGLIFIVSGDVYIKDTVVTIQAVIITAGTNSKIYTASIDSSLTCNSSDIDANALTIDGSLIALNNNNSPIVFCRKKVPNDNPVEIINHQPKYLVLFKDLMGSDIKRWSEVVGDFPQ